MEQYGAAHDIPNNEIYEAVRGNWKISIRRAQRAKGILAVARGLVRGAYIANKWFDSDEAGRKRFDGVEAARPFSDLIGQSVTSHFGRGGQNPVRFLNCN